MENWLQNNPYGNKATCVSDDVHISSVNDESYDNVKFYTALTNAVTR